MTNDVGTWGVRPWDAHDLDLFRRKVASREYESFTPDEARALLQLIDGAQHLRGALKGCVLALEQMKADDAHLNESRVFTVGHENALKAAREAQFFADLEGDATPFAVRVEQTAARTIATAEELSRVARIAEGRLRMIQAMESAMIDLGKRLGVPENEGPDGLADAVENLKKDQSDLFRVLTTIVVFGGPPGSRSAAWDVTLREARDILDAVEAHGGAK